MSDGYDGPAQMVPGVATGTVIDPDADVKNPKHYKMAIEPIEFIVKNDIPYREGNVIKYVCRWRNKDGVRDLKKARQYLDMMIADLEI